MTRVSDLEFDGHDSNVVQRLRAGDVSALEVLIDLYGAQLQHIALVIVHRTDLADDVVQDTFVNLWNRRESLTDVQNLPGYLCRMARNIAIKVVRHEQAEQRAHDTVERAYQTGTLGAAVNDGVVNLEMRELSATIQRVLDTLQPQVREIFFMRRFHGMSYDEIATILGISVISARSQMSRAVRYLAEGLQELR